MRLYARRVTTEVIVEMGLFFEGFLVNWVEMGTV
jgi:hypothetical protein